MLPDHQLNPKEWVKNYGDYLLSLAVVKTGSKETAEDLVQETFLSAVKAIASFKGNSTEKTWLVAILNNKIIDHYRKKDVLKSSSDYLAATESSFHERFFETNPDEYGHWLAATAPKEWNTESRLDQAEFYRILRYCMDKLPLKLRPVFLAKFIDEEETDKICKDFDLTSSNYWVIIHRAKILMRSCLEKNWFLSGQQ